MVPGWQIEAYERLRTEIVKSAVKDLRKAFKKSDRIGCVCDEQIKMEKWFLSRWGQMLCGGNGEYIIEKCRQTYKSRSYSNGKPKMPDDVQKAVYAAWKSKMRFADIQEKYGISKSQLYRILRRWDR